MPPQLGLRMTRKREEGPCGHCEGMIEKGELHASVVMKLGLSPKGKQRYKLVHLHVANCLSLWLIADHVRWSERKKKDETKGAEIIGLTDEEKGRRQWLVRTRARLIREITRESDDSRVRSKYARLQELTKELVEVGGVLRQSKAHRTESARSAFYAKVAVSRELEPLHD